MTLLHPHKNYQMIFSDHRWSGSRRCLSAEIRTSSIANTLGGRWGTSRWGRGRWGVHSAPTLLFPAPKFRVFGAAWARSSGTSSSEGADHQQRSGGGHFPGNFLQKKRMLEDRVSKMYVLWRRLPAANRDVAFCAALEGGGKLLHQEPVAFPSEEGAGSSSPRARRDLGCTGSGSWHSLFQFSNANKQIPAGY